VAEVHVSPETFTYVEYDAGVIAEAVARLADAVGLPVDLRVEVVVDESVPLLRARVIGLDPVVLDVEGGALEDLKRPRRYDPAGAEAVLCRLLLEVGDRLDPAFGAPDLDEDLSLELRTAWDVLCAGRAARLGRRPQQQRWRYAFRTRHGFTDAADAAFERLWRGAAATWPEVVAVSDAARAVAA
jgi:hypothetical protein